MKSQENKVVLASIGHHGPHSHLTSKEKYTYGKGSRMIEVGVVRSATTIVVVVVVVVVVVGLVAC
jgi:hypothetical protein